MLCFFSWIRKHHTRKVLSSLSWQRDYFFLLPSEQILPNLLDNDHTSVTMRVISSKKQDIMNTKWETRQILVHRANRKEEKGSNTTWQDFSPSIERLLMFLKNKRQAIRTRRQMTYQTPLIAESTSSTRHVDSFSTVVEMTAFFDTTLIWWRRCRRHCRDRKTRKRCDVNGDSMKEQIACFFDAE